MIVMTILIGAALLFSLFFTAYRSGRRLLSETPSSNPVLTRLLSAAGEKSASSQLDSYAERREADLTRQLLHGSLAADAYRQAMSELAESDSSQTGSVR
jgi:hypothetical protein